MAAVDMKVGERIRTYRERLQMSVGALAETSGVSAPVIEAIEAGEAYPALGILVKLSRGLGQRLGTFMDDQFKPDPVIVKAADRVFEKASHMEALTEELRYAPLGRGKPDRHMDPFFIDVVAGSAAPLSSHEGEEFLFVLTGEALLLYGTEEHALKTGDSVYYNSLVPHAVRSYNNTASTLLAAVFMPM
jgi:transcriptional regulator with XRE-family HTH domain